MKARQCRLRENNREIIIYSENSDNFLTKRLKNLFTFLTKKRILYIVWIIFPLLKLNFLFLKTKKKPARHLMSKEKTNKILL